MSSNDDHKPEKIIFPIWLNDLLGEIGSLRDGFLITLGAIYAFGYFVWAINSWRLGLGLLSALNLQYFVAGFLPMAIGALAYFLGRRFRKFILDEWQILVGKGATGIWRIIRNLLLLLFYGFFLTFAFGPVVVSTGILIYIVWMVLKRVIKINWEDSWLLKPFDELTQGWHKGLRSIILLGIIGVFLGLFFQREELEKNLIGSALESIEQILTFGFLIAIILLPPMEDKFFVSLSKIYRWLLINGGVPFLVLIATLFYAESVYPVLPQAIGGGLPRCAFLDVDPTKLSEETATLIMPIPDPDSLPSIQRSLQLDVYFSNDEVLMVRSFNQRSDPDFPILEIPHTIVESISWCD